MTSSAVREAMERTSAAIAADPGKARARNVPATARLIEGLKCEITGPQAGPASRRPAWHFSEVRPRRPGR